MFTSAIKKIKGKPTGPAVDDSAAAADSLRTGIVYLWVSVAIAIAAAIYGLFSHGVYSYFMTYAFMIPLLAGAMPHLMTALKDRTENGSAGKISFGMSPEGSNNRMPHITAADIQTAVVATLTAGSIMKGVLDIYGTTNRLLIAYPVIAVLILAAAVAAKLVPGKEKAER